MRNAEKKDDLDGWSGTRRMTSQDGNWFPDV